MQKTLPVPALLRPPAPGACAVAGGGAHPHRGFQQGIPRRALPVGCAGGLPAGRALVAGGHQPDGGDVVPEEKESGQPLSLHLLL